MPLRITILASITMVLAAGLFAFGKVTGGFFAWFIFYVFVVLAVYEWITMLCALVGVQSRRRLAISRLTAGQQLDVQVQLRRNGFWPLFWVRIYEQLPARWVFQANGLERVHVPLWQRSFTYAYTVKNLPRGIYTLGDTTVETGDLLGLIRVKRRLPAMDRVVVFPKVTPVRGWGGPSLDEYGDRQPTHRRSEESSNVIGVRDYVQGDRLNRIHWPVTARRGRLQAKEFELHVTSELKFIPDNTRLSYAGAQAAAKFDLAMSITASLLRYAYDRHQKFGMVVPSDSHFSVPTGLDAALLGHCMEALAAMQPQSARDLGQFLQRIGEEAPRATVFVIISPRLDREMALAVSQLKRQGTVHLFVPMLHHRLTEAEHRGYEMLQKAGAQLYLIDSLGQLSFLHRGGTDGAATTLR